jgi:hypothetical protein
MGNDSKIFVARLAKDATERDLERLGKESGEVKRVQVLNGK